MCVFFISRWGCRMARTFGIVGGSRSLGRTGTSQSAFANEVGLEFGDSRQIMYDMCVELDQVEF